MNRHIVTCCAVLVCAGTSLGASITFSDGDFAATDWSLTTIVQEGTGNTSAARHLVGGNPGSFREVTINLTGTDVYNRVTGFHALSGAVFDPRLGAITSVDYEEDAILLIGFGQGQATGPALRQDGTVFVYMLPPRNPPPLFTPDRTWTRKAVTGLSALDFIHFPDAARNPDFSVNGSPIEFGFFRMNSAGPYSIVAGIDNMRIDVNFEPIPEPGSVGFLLLGFGVLALGLCRRSRVS